MCSIIAEPIEFWVRSISYIDNKHSQLSYTYKFCLVQKASMALACSHLEVRGLSEPPPFPSPRLDIEHATEVVLARVLDI